MEYQTGKNSKFEKIPAKNQYYINTDPLIFSHFKQKLTISRTFTVIKLFFAFGQI